MGRRGLIFIVSILLGLGIGGMARSNWPEVTWRGMTWKGPPREKLPLPDEVVRMAGLTPVEGQGIRVVVQDSTKKRRKALPVERLIVHERHLLLMRNELFAAGASAMSINGNRIVATTEIRCVGAAIRINGRNNVPPYVVDAVGDAETLKQTIMMMGGVVDLLATENLRVEVETFDKLVIPAYGTVAAQTGRGAQ